MHVIHRPGWRLPDSAASPEHLFFDRRAALKGLLAAGALPFLPTMTRAQTNDDPSAKLYPARRNETYKVDTPITPEDVNGAHNNFLEFGSSKSIARAAQALNTRPWRIVIDGMVEKPFEIDIDDLLAKVSLEERVYRLRCVETWSMTVPWTGFPMKALVALAKPLSGATYVRMETFKDTKVSPAQRRSWYPWPYVEGCTLAEATNDVAFMVTGAYGKPLPKQHGAPIRLHMPWKYGFKGVKSIKRITFTDKRPLSFWQELQGEEYGFWANVNPDVPHERWSQASETLLDDGRRIKTKIWNGYGEWVADLYKDIDQNKEKLFT